MLGAVRQGITGGMRFVSHMETALAEARAAGLRGEVPVGAVVVDAGGRVVAAAGNRTRELSDPTAHAEVLALRAACAAAGSERLPGHDLYVTLEPCPMCAGAIILARIPEVYYGAPDPKAGCCGTLMDLLNDSRFNHNPTVQYGLLASECGGLLTSFFRALRNKGSSPE